MAEEHVDGVGEDQSYWFDPRTGEVSQGKQRSWQGRMGPYSTREEAQQALEKAADRSQQWDEEERLRREEDQLWDGD